MNSRKRTEFTLKNAAHNTTHYFTTAGHSNQKPFTIKLTQMIQAVLAASAFTNLVLSLLFIINSLSAKVI